MKKLVTHSGKFHADDVFATAVLKKVFKEIELVRSRDPDTVASGDIVYDVGRVYDPATNRFDHHQPEGAGVRENGVPYAAFGLIWKHFGEQLVTDKRVWQLVDEKLVQPVDANDTGFISSAAKNGEFDNYVLDRVAGAFNPSWSEPYEDAYNNFMYLVSFAEALIDREIVRATDAVQGMQEVEKVYQAADDKRVIILEKGYPWKEVLVDKSEPLFVIYPEVDTDRFMIQAVNVAKSGYETRKAFPKAWAGLVDDELQQASGIAGARFCHSACFLCVNDTKEGAVQMAYAAIEA